MTTTVSTWKAGDKVECNGNKQAVVQGHYSGNMFNVRLWDGFRHIGDVCVDGRELKARDSKGGA